MHAQQARCDRAAWGCARPWSSRRRRCIRRRARAPAGATASPTRAVEHTGPPAPAPLLRQPRPQPGRALLARREVAPQAPPQTLLCEAGPCSLTGTLQHSERCRCVRAPCGASFFTRKIRRCWTTGKRSTSSLLRACRTADLALGARTSLCACLGTRRTSAKRPGRAPSPEPRHTATPMRPLPRVRSVSSTSATGGNCALLR
jgi:hypothetical protein